MNTDIGEYTDIKLIHKLLDIRDKKVADIGCGDGAFAASIAENGARVIGIEPNPIQAEQNRKTTPISGLELLEAGAQMLPLEDMSQDICVFRFSFHHIPEKYHAQVFKEAARVLKPGGKLLIIEPVAAGSSQYVMELFHDETKVRAQVQQALATLAPIYFEHQHSYTYKKTHAYVDFSAYLDRYAKLSYNSYHPDSVSDQAVRNRFNEFTDTSGTTELSQPIKADLFIRQQAFTDRGKRI